MQLGRETIATAAFVGVTSGISGIGSRYGQHWPEFSAVTMVAIGFSGLTGALLSFLAVQERRVFHGVLVVAAAFNAAYVGVNVTSSGASTSLSNWLLLTACFAWCHGVGVFVLSYFGAIELGARRKLVKGQWSLKEQTAVTFILCMTLALSLAVAANWGWWVAFHFIVEPFLLSAGACLILFRPGLLVLRVAGTLLYSSVVGFGFRFFESGWNYRRLASAFQGDRYNHLDYGVNCDTSSQVASALCLAIASIVVALAHSRSTAVESQSAHALER